MYITLGAARAIRIVSALIYDRVISYSCCDCLYRCKLSMHDLEELESATAGVVSRFLPPFLYLPVIVNATTRVETARMFGYLALFACA